LLCFDAVVTLDPFRAFIRELAAISAEAILPYFGNAQFGLEIKSDDSPVTLADRSAELVMRRLIEKRFPNHGIIGEEYGTERGDAEFVWVLDPVDGTKSFITAVPLFTTLIGLLHEGRPVMGCIHQPVLRQLMVGDGTETLLNERAVRVRPTAGLAAATLLTSDPLFPAKYQDGRGFDALCRAVRLYRTFGDGYGYLLLASGWADVMVDPIMKPWDLLPLIPCITGAGGQITDWQGKDASLPTAESAVACSAALHGEVIHLLNAQA
jgi:myo-inositol-1(or 4)-monophosphatase